MQGFATGQTFETDRTTPSAPMAATASAPALDLDLNGDPAGTLHLVSGMLGTGRETLLSSLERRLVEAGVPSSLVMRTDLLDFRMRMVGSGTLSQAVDGYLDRFPEARRSRFYLLIDHIDNAPGWERPMGHLLNAYDVVAVATGAGESWHERLAAGAFPAGTRLHQLHPRALGYASLFPAEDLAIEPPAVLSERAERAFESYLAQGGLVPLSAHGLQLLLRIAIADDVISRNPTFQLPLCIACAVVALGATGNNLSVSHVTDYIGQNGISTTRATVTRMLEALQEAQLVHFSPEFRHARSENARMSRVVYAADHGLARACGREGELERVALLRTVAHNELRRRGLREICYYRTAARHNVHLAWGDTASGQVEGMIQVTTGAPGSRRFERSASILAAGMAEVGLERATLLCPADETTLHRRGRTIDVRPLWRWLVDR